MIFNPNDYSVVFLSYDEPNCEENYQQLLTLRPGALRVHGVKGSDTAHKKCAELSLTSRVSIVDADNFVKPSFTNTHIYLPDTFDMNTSVLSYAGENIVNGNVYGNGGIKNWPVSLLKSMRTHENGDKDSVDFDFSNYIQLNEAASEVRINSSPKQAWRAGFREGIKLSHDKHIDWRNHDRLWRWMHLGQDVENGLWAIHGCRFAFYLSRIKHWDHPENVRDFDSLEVLFNEVAHLTPNKLMQDCERLAVQIKLFADRTTTSVLTSRESKEYKETIAPILRSPDYRAFDIVFISYNEPYADENYKRLIDRFPNAKRINGVKGIHQAHKEAAKLCTTDYFWVVDADAEIVDTFVFHHVFPFYEQPKVRVWRSKNAVNDLVYGNGGVKLLPRTLVLRMNTNTTDMTTSICDSYEPIFELSNTNCFNTDEFSTWRSAFRECAKLSSQSIRGQVSEETLARLETWCTVGADRPFGELAIKGAKAGKSFGEEFKDDYQMLALINDYDWLRKKFNE
jgi:hypothetical protein